MVSNKVQVDIEGEARGIQGAIGGIRSGIIGTLGDIGNIATGVQSVMSLTAGAVQPIVGAINSASSANLELINTTNQFAAISQLSYADSKVALQGLSREMNNLANTLPGTNDNYLTLATSITDNLIPAVKELDGEFTTEGLNNYAKGLSKNFGFIAATTENTASQIGLGLNRALTEGVTLATLRNLQAFESNPALIAQIEKVSEQMGVEFDKATVGQRVQILEQASAISTEALEAASQDISVILNTLQSKLFGQEGIFSLRRLVGDGEGNKTDVISEIGKTASAMLSPDGPLGGIFDAIGGIDFDPMQSLALGIINFRENTLPQLGAFADQFMTALGSGDLGGMINDMLANIENLDFTQIGFIIGNALGEIVNFITNILSQIDYGPIQAAMINIMEGIGVGILAFASSVDWGQLAMAGLNIIVQQVSSSISMIVGIIGSAVTGAASQISADTVARISSIVGIVTSAIGGPVGAIKAAIQAVGAAFSSMASLISGIPAAVSAATGGISRAISAARSAAASIPIPTFATGNFPNTLAGSVLKEASAMPSGARLALANTSEAILNTDQQRNLLENISQSGDNNVINISIGQADNDTGRRIIQELDQYFTNRARLA